MLNKGEPFLLGWATLAVLIILILTQSGCLPGDPTLEWVTDTPQASPEAPDGVLPASPAPDVGLGENVTPETPELPTPTQMTMTPSVAVTPLGGAPQLMRVACASAALMRYNADEGRMLLAMALDESGEPVVIYHYPPELVVVYGRLRLYETDWCLVAPGAGEYLQCNCLEAVE